jgi:hypothetical protein
MARSQAGKRGHRGHRGPLTAPIDILRCCIDCLLGRLRLATCRQSDRNETASGQAVPPVLVAPVSGVLSTHYSLGRGFSPSTLRSRVCVLTADDCCRLLLPSTMSPWLSSAV